MNEIVFLQKVLSEVYLKKDAEALLMLEPADTLHSPQRVTIDNRLNSLSDLYLYDFSKANEDGNFLLPFFNHRKIAPNISPKGLTKFCDYILLLSHEDIPYVFFLELKRGICDDADKQIEASEMFMDYVIDSAERIKGENNVSDFDKQRIRFRRIIVQEEHSNKRQTKREDINVRDINSVLKCRCEDRFFPIYYCIG